MPAKNKGKGGKTKAEDTKKTNGAANEANLQLANEAKEAGNEAFKAERWADAEEHFSKAISLDKTNHVFFSNRSACYVNLGDFEKGLEDAQACVKLAPRWVKGYGRVATAYHRLGELRAAKAAYEEGLDLDEDNTGLREGLEEVKKDMVDKKNAVKSQVNQAKEQQYQDRVATEEANKAKEQAANPEDSVVVGIDLGTTYSCVSVWQNGRVEVLANDVGERTTPSFVSFGEDGERMVGQAGKAQAARFPQSTFFNVKRIIGQSYSDAYKEIQLYPFKVEDKDGRPMIPVELNGATKTYAPEEISAMVLEKMKATAEAALGHKVKRAVITVPAYFNDAQRRSTKTAGTIAGLTVERIINEPTAAALAYGLDSKGEGNILVFDLGGGTFDVSLLCIESGMFEVLATAGDTHLGGEDFDAALQEFVREEFKKKAGGKDVFHDNHNAQRKLRNACERAKRLLSTATTASIELELGGDDLTMQVSRATFERLNEKMFERCLVAVKRVLEDAKVKKESVDEVVLVGGSTRVPRVQALLQEFFSGKQLCKSVNPDEAVAYGAAVQGAILAGIRDPSMMQLILVDVIPLTLGIETEGRVFAKVVPRNTSVPCEKTRDFTTVEDNQTEVDIRVYEGERGCTDGNHLLGEFHITGIERAKRGVPKIDVTFSLNVNGMLTVRAKDRATGSTADIQITNDKGRHSDEDIDRMLKEAERLREEDERHIAEQEAKAEERYAGDSDSD
eukprot:NODE_100_length_2545_cov_148.215946_g67_i0.p1 GENE.NODE_100_length_2545_cov_148.215946_g67_i0~~NODE_100_length_2545_cov_148.215946_g67_i0.p1  ORF type:complete len:733 (+),score=271.53 NODE_100_length_2545_cov_148.215946_g67_i0:75-2273(+)